LITFQTTLKAFGVTGILFTVKGIVANYNDCGFGEATTRTVIDLVAVAASIPSGPVGGLAASYGAEILKNALFE
jgi:hypothetical protein